MVLSTTINDGAPAGGNGVIYFVGEYDGVGFANENPIGTVLWADYGRDFDGQQSWSNLPADDGRLIWTAVMQSYGEAVPTTPWRGQMAIPRKLELFDDGSSIRLRQQPIEELQSLRNSNTNLTNIRVPTGTFPLSQFGISGDMLEIIAEFDAGSASSFGVTVRESNDGKLGTTIGYDVVAGQLFVDRSRSGNADFSPAASGVHFAPLALDDGKVKFHIFVDRSTIEVFGNDGIKVISDLIFPFSDAVGVSIFANGGEAVLLSLDVHRLDSIWQIGDEPESGSSVIARWSMDALPQAVGVPWLGPVSIDSKILPGEGAKSGTINPFFEPNSSVENLWMFGRREMPTSPVFAPTAMFNGGFAGGASSFNAGTLASTDDRGLHMPAGLYGDEFAFDDGFSIEMFFRTDVDRSNSGWMQLILESDADFRFSVIANEGGAGNIRFAVNDGAGQIPVVDMNSVTARNYADANWHYLLATYDPAIGVNGNLRLLIANEDGSVDVAETDIPTSFQGLKAAGTGNLLIGRHNRFLNSDPRNFLGLIDEVQITDGRVLNKDRLGRLPDELVFCTAEIESFDVITGDLVSGDVNTILENDDNELVIGAVAPDEAFTPPAELLVTLRVQGNLPKSLRAVVDSRANSIGLMQEILLLNWTNGDFDVFHVDHTSTTSSTAVFDICENPTEYVQPVTGEICAKLQWKPKGPVLFFPWRVFVDKIQVLYE